MGKKSYQRKYDPILPGPRDWPVVRLSKNRKEFIEEVSNASYNYFLQKNPNIEDLRKVLESALYKERLRIKQNPWKVDPEDDRQFWGNVKKKLIESTSEENNSNGEIEKKLLKDIVERYTEEITGNFKKSRYRIARSIAILGFSRLLNAAKLKSLKGLFRTGASVRDSIIIKGEVDQLRDLAKKGTIVMVPTHFSNLDSITIGWVIYELGLPPFIYGAGLNLFNIGIFAYFMESLGAYKVDRRKKNKIYLETLKIFSNLALQEGCHSLFFPGGTRSRSGAIEEQLKLGLLGTTVEAQRYAYQHMENGEVKKIYIVPVSLNYHFVLEAPALIRQYLEIKGQERYYDIEMDRFSNSSKILKFLFKFFNKDSQISVSIGKAHDVIGNYVDEEGRSLDKNGRVIHLRDYFVSKGEVIKDNQRESEYTRMLSKKIITEYHRINRAFSSQIAAFVAFEIFLKRFPDLDLYDFLRLPEEDLYIKYDEFRAKFSDIRERIYELKKENKIDTASHLERDLDDCINFGIENVGMYHVKRPLYKTKEGNIMTQDLSLLYYYHNHMSGYGLEKYI